MSKDFSTLSDGKNDDGSIIGLLYVNAGSRDAIISASTFLVMLRDMVQDLETKLDITKVTDHLADMLYGFDERKNV